MTLNLDKSTWKRVAFDDVVTNVNVTVKDPAAVGITRVIAMEHLDPGELKISRWGSLEDGTTFTRRVRSGQTLFGKRRAYQRKAAYAEFDAICSSDILVFQADEDRVVPEFLPFLVQSAGFYDHALGTSAGSLSPRTNWRDLANYEFELPPPDEQKRIAHLLWALESHREIVASSASKAAEVLRTSLPRLLLQETSTGEQVPISEVAKVKHGFAFSGEYFSEDPDLPTVVTPGNFAIGGGFQASAPKTYAGPIDPAYVLAPGDLIVTMTDLSKAGDTLGYSAEVPDDLVYLHNQRIGKVVILDEHRLSARFLGWILRTAQYRSHILSTAAGSTVRHTSPARIEAFRIILPPLSAQEQAVAKIEKIERAVRLIRREVEVSVALKRAFLGEIFGRT